MTKPYAEVIGDPIAHSKSPLIHNFWLRRLGIDAEYRACHVKPEELADYFAARRKDPDWRGCNVTIPHKVAVVGLVDQVDPLAARIGAVNTVVCEPDGSLIGYNTDAPGFLEPLEPLPARDSDGMRGHAVVVGAGGAARAVVCALWDKGFHIDILNRDVAKARGLANDFGAPVTAYSKLDTNDWPVFFRQDPHRPRRVHNDLVLLINTTSLGMSGMPPLGLSLEGMSRDVIVYDLVYSPLETDLLGQASKYGMDTVDGLAMLIGQAGVAFEKFFGQPAPRDHDVELRKLLTA